MTRLISAKVKSTTPETYKFKDEAKSNRDKHQLGFIANNVKEHIPEEWGNIVIQDDAEDFLETELRTYES